ncbi:hypothetical protein [Desulfogranum mediterraneum]|uniref:hypothetical protein n=1 Tax=Desulfogranum mediterraneum TaxID=160661 RepID=UPI0004107F65|nr:hypothetical protein [Desulfogranum mediterraneum]
MKMISFRYQKHVSTLLEPKERSGINRPHFPFASLNSPASPPAADEENKKNMEQIQHIGQSNGIILGSWQ